MSCGVQGFSHGATVALEMVLSGLFRGPVVLLGISPTTANSAQFFRRVVRAAERVGVWPMAILLRLMPLMVRSAKTRPRALAIDRPSCARPCACAPRGGARSESGDSGDSGGASAA